MIAQKDIEDIDSVILNYTAYGANFLKQKANLSPDAFVQMVLQLAYFRLHGSFTPVYESSSTRQFCKYWIFSYHV